MRCTIFSAFLVAVAGSAVASPIAAPGSGNVARQSYPGYPSFPGFNNNYNPYSNFDGSDDFGGSVSTGDSGDVDGGSVTNDAGAAGTITNTASCKPSCTEFWTFG